MLVASLFLRYYAAIDAKKERTSKHAQSFGTKNPSQNTTPNQVQNITPTLSGLYFNKPNTMVNISAGSSAIGSVVCQKYCCYFHNRNCGSSSLRWPETAGF